MEGYVKTNKDNILFSRKFDCISQYVYTDLETHEVNKNIKQLGNELEYQYVGVSVNEVNAIKWDDKSIYSITALDVDANTDTDALTDFITSFSKFNEIIKDHKVLILIIPDSMRIPEEYVDIYIEMKSKLRFDYQINSLSIRKSRTQNCALGWHQYKRYL